MHTYCYVQQLSSCVRHTLSTLQTLRGPMCLERILSMGRHGGSSIAPSRGVFNPCAVPPEFIIDTMIFRWVLAWEQRGTIVGPIQHLVQYVCPSTIGRLGPVCNFLFARHRVGQRGVV